MKLKVHSLRIEHIRTYNNRDDDFEDNSKYILNCISQNNLKYEVSLWTEYGDCPSGWCSASWGHCEVKLVDSFIGSTHKPLKDLPFEIEKGLNLAKKRLVVKYLDNQVKSIAKAM